MRRFTSKKRSIVKLPLTIFFIIVLLIGLGLFVILQKTMTFDTRSNADFSATKIQKGALLWMQDSNGGKSGEALPDFKEQFEHPELWANTRQYIDVYQFHNFVFTDPQIGVDDAFLRDKMIPVLNQSDIKIALNVTGANWAKCGSRADIMYEDAAIIDRIVAAGGQVSYLTMQSTLSKVEDGNSESLNQCAPYPQKKRIDDIVRYMNFMKNKYPNMQFGMTDADATKGNDYKASLRELRSELGKKNLRLDYLFLDNIAKFLDAGTEKELKEVEQFVRQDLNINFGLVYMANKFKVKSNGAYKTSVLQDYQSYNKAGGRPTYYMVTSWFEYPETYLPETGNTLLGTVLAIGQRMQSGGPGNRTAEETPLEATPTRVEPINNNNNNNGNNNNGNGNNNNNGNNNKKN